jgi:DNA integrity scanning protein DisA with diadenylate cyclase activity
MKLYRFEVSAVDGGGYFLQCVHASNLFTQASTMDEAVVMARDVVLALLGDRHAQIELVIPPSIVVADGPSRGRGKPRRRRTAAAGAR